jgi:hypothetical protein
MKTKLFLLALLFSVCGALFAQEEQAIKFEERVHDFGTINEVDGDGTLITVIPELYANSALDDE